MQKWEEKKKRRKAESPPKGGMFMDTKTIQLRKKGVITVPVEMRRKYDLSEGNVFTLVELGQGAFMLAPGVSEIDRLGDRTADLLREQGVSYDDLLEALEEEREQYYKEKYA
jgi:bifunctional DNA-binding transcriptional regulator/antitoxin component of YhaV-PrlF toxin-antitoxin module